MFFCLVLRIKLLKHQTPDCKIEKRRLGWSSSHSWWETSYWKGIKQKCKNWKGPLVPGKWRLQKSTISYVGVCTVESTGEFAMHISLYCLSIRSRNVAVYPRTCLTWPLQPPRVKYTTNTSNSIWSLKWKSAWCAKDWSEFCLPWPIKDYNHHTRFQLSCSTVQCDVYSAMCTMQ